MLQAHLSYRWLVAGQGGTQMLHRANPAKDQRPQTLPTGPAVTLSHDTAELAL